MERRSAWIEISSENIRYNINQIKSKVGDTKVVGVIKADAYGHGAVNFARILKEENVDTFAVATMQEAIELREAGFADQRIIVLGLIPDSAASEAVSYGLTPVVCGYSGAKSLSEAASAADSVIDCLIAIDTGMGRIGYTVCNEDEIADIKEISLLKGIKLFGLFSHFATADAFDKTFAIEQYNKYNMFYKELEKNGIDVGNRILANSAAIMDLPQTYYDYVRPGIILYGIYPSKEVEKKNLSLRPVMSVKADVVYLKKVPAGTSIGYGRTYKADDERLIATLPLGYADGLPRLCSNKGRVIINGMLAPIVGNVCMDQCMVDVTGIPNVEVGSTAILMGNDGTLAVTADDIADIAMTIPYEITCGFGQRLEKFYL